MDYRLQLMDKFLPTMTSGSQWAFGSTALFAVAIVVYCRSHSRLITATSDLPQKTLDRIKRLRDASNTENDDPPLLQKHSTFESYTTSYATYPSVRTFYHPHPQAHKLPPHPNPLPLLVLIHGLGGSLAQFAPLLRSWVNTAPCLGIDLPGCGLSKFDPREWEAYSIDAMATLVAQVVDRHRAVYGHKDVVLIGHSMGCSIAALHASTSSRISLRLDHVAGLIAICPKGMPPSTKESWYLGKILSLPDPLLDLVRWFDRRGGVTSPSVIRFVGEAAGLDLKKLQFRFNSSFPTAVWRRMAWGCLPVYDKAGVAHGGIPGRSVWAGLKVPLFLIAGQSDTVTKPEEVSIIVSFLNDAYPTNLWTRAESMAVPAEVDVGGFTTENNKAADADDTKVEVQASTTELGGQHSTFIKTAILPAPATHALFYDPSMYRTLAGLIDDFLSHHISHRLDLGWQLQQLTTSGKWDVKNLEKWQAVSPVSEPIAGGIFRALKTLRDQDEEHTPAVFAEKWRDRIYAIIDISHDSPVYDPKLLEQNGIHYHKFPTVSKIPPTIEEVRAFIGLVDRLRCEIDGNSNSSVKSKCNLPAIAVHCHYGYNRTGFFIVSYLVDKEGYRVQEATDEFERRRPPGIKHEHFFDTLFLRYCLGLGRTPSI